MTTYSMTAESLTGKGPFDALHDDGQQARAVVARMNQLLAIDNIEMRLGREDSCIEFDHKCSIENALARALHSA